LSRENAREGRRELLARSPWLHPILAVVRMVPLGLVVVHFLRMFYLRSLIDEKVPLKFPPPG
jgi:hypothetical protein